VWAMCNKHTGLCFRDWTVQYRNVLSPNLAVTLDIAGPSNIGGDIGCWILVEFLRLVCGGVFIFGTVDVVGWTNSGSNTVSKTRKKSNIKYNTKI